MDSYKIFRQLEEREKRKNPYKFYDKDELIDTIIELEDNIEDLQSKIDKAKEYIKNTTLFTEDYDYDYEENLVWNGATDEKEREELLNILQGEDK